MSRYLEVYLISPFTVVYEHMLIFNLFLILDLKMTVERSKSQRSFLTLTFIVNSVPKKLCLKIFVNFKYVSIF